MLKAASYSRKTKVYSGILLFLVIIFTTTRPGSLPEPIIAVVLAAVTALIYGASGWLLSFTPLPTVKTRFATVAVTAISGLILVLQATGQLTLRDLLSVLAIFAVGWIYVTRFSLARGS